VPTNENEVNSLSEKNFTYHAYFVSRLPMFSISIIKWDESRKILFSICRFCDTTRSYKIVFADSSVLGTSDLNYLYSVLDTISLLEMKSDSNLVIDGMVVHNTVCIDSLKHEFSFIESSKVRNPKEYKIVEALIGLASRKFTKPKQQIFFEDIEVYFDFGLPCKKISDNPYEIRIYGRPSKDERVEFKRFINLLPSNKPILVDLTNFKRYDGANDDLFRILNLRNSNIIWVTKNRTQLIGIGVDPPKIVDNIIMGRILISNADLMNKLGVTKLPKQYN
jgi:hypothetical protein